MQIKFLFSAVFAALVLFVSSAASAMTIEVGYPYSALFDVTIKDNIVPMFEKAHPGIKVKLRATYDNYEDAANTILRESVAGKLPDVTFQGLNHRPCLLKRESRSHWNLLLPEKLILLRMAIIRRCWI